MGLKKEILVKETLFGLEELLRKILQAHTQKTPYYPWDHNKAFPKKKE